MLFKSPPYTAAPKRAATSICSPFLPQTVFVLDSSSISLDLFLCLGFPKSSFLLDPQLVYAIHIYSGKTQIIRIIVTLACHHWCHFIGLKINILKTFPIGNHSKRAKKQTQEVLTFLDSACKLLSMNCNWHTGCISLSNKRCGMLKREKASFLPAGLHH